MRIWIILVPVFLFMSFSPVHADEMLRVEDVHKVMDQILKQHSGDHEMTDQVLQSSLVTYINQFDPQRVYLFKQESDEYSNLASADQKIMLQEYKKNSYKKFESLNLVIQNSIKRAREYRKELMERKEYLFQKSTNNPSKLELENEGIKKSFAETVDEIKRRIENEIILFISQERQRYGDLSVMENKEKTLQAYDRFFRHKENQYLYQDDKGLPLPPSEQQNLFYMHVLKALSGTLDSHTAFLNSDEAYDMRVTLEKGFHGVGIILQSRPDGIVISRLIKGGPAEKSGLVKVGDQILKINDENVEGYSAQELVVKLRDDGKDRVELVLKRPTDDGAISFSTIPVTLNREFIEVNDGRVDVKVAEVPEGLIGILALHAFYQGESGVTSEKDVREAINKLKSQGNLKGVILDLRDNGGGFLNQAVKVAGLFISNGVVVVSKYSNGEQHFYRDMDGKISFNGPLIILTSKETASAAEIVAQSLQDYGVAIVVGDERTYGKGTIQSQTVTDGSQGSHFKVTVGKYYTVSGKTPQVQGVRADVLAPGPYNNEHIGEEYLQNHLSADSIESSFKDTLADVDGGLKPWFLRYYMPTLQGKETALRSLIPSLKAESEKRIAANSGYQKFLKEGGHFYGGSSDRMGEALDYQQQEAVNIMKDIIRMEQQNH